MRTPNCVSPEMMTEKMGFVMEGLDLSSHLLSWSREKLKWTCGRKEGGEGGGQGEGGGEKERGGGGSRTEEGAKKERRKERERRGRGEERRTQRRDGRREKWVKKEGERR